MKTWLLRIPLFSFIYFVLLFDKDGAQLGTAIFDNVPSAVIGTASIFGNLFWLFGAVFLLVGLILGIMSFDENSSKKTLKEFTGKKREKLFKMDPVGRVLGIVTTLFAIGSGFWFYGLGGITISIGLYMWVGALKKMADKIDEENGVEKPFNALDLAKSNLLDD